MNSSPIHLAVLLASIIASSASVPQQFGSCNMSEMLDRTTTCENNFIGTMAGNADASCSGEYDKLEKCFMTHMRGCFVGHLKPAMLNHTLAIAAELLTLLGSEQFFCTDQVLGWDSIPILVKISLPCREEFFKEGTKCSGSFRTTFTKDRTDAALCREYEKAKDCSYNITLHYCDDMGVKRDDYNPFCGRNKDPVATAGGGTRSGLAGQRDNSSSTTEHHKPSTVHNKRIDDTSTGARTVPVTMLTRAVTIGLVSLVCVAFA